MMMMMIDFMQNSRESSELTQDNGQDDSTLPDVSESLFQCAQPPLAVSGLCSYLQQRKTKKHCLNPAWNGVRQCCSSSCHQALCCVHVICSIAVKHNMLEENAIFVRTASVV